MPILLAMFKRQNNAPKPARKRKKGNTTYQISSLDPPDDEMAVEDLRVWDVSTSEKTGRVTAKRRTLKHYHQAPPSIPEEPPTCENPEGGEDVTNVEDTGALADSESPLETVNKRRPKRKRKKVSKENDSVGGRSIPPLSG